MDKDIINTYNNESNTLIEQYESKTFEEIHQFALKYIPENPATVLDIGSGSGRDVAWFAKQGYQVVAVEPAIELRTKAQSLHPSSAITWLDDALPDLTQTLGINQCFDLVWLSAVWMHLPETVRRDAFSNMSSMLNPNGRVMISLRHGTPPQGRKVYKVSANELIGFARDNGLVDLCIQEADDGFNREGVWWQTVVLEKANG
ncbi:MAG: class I SAM-dependent methyltransferase [Halioglobus sp.]|nr:class I SAM-dependent methyltransferase [Halioglobus sp.]